MNAGEVETHVVAALRARREGPAQIAPVPSRDDLVATIRLAYASAERRALRSARQAV